MIRGMLLNLALLCAAAASGPQGTTVYTPEGKRDPFAPRGREQGSTAETPLTAPLRRIAISELVVVGTAVGKPGGFALVQGPDRLTHLAPVKARFADGFLVRITGDWLIFQVEGMDAERTWVVKRTRSTGE